MSEGGGVVGPKVGGRERGGVKVDVLGFNAKSVAKVKSLKTLIQEHRD
jgi:hypothetical protein